MKNKKLFTYCLRLCLCAWLVAVSSCGFRKVKEIRQNKATGNVEYAIWIYDDFNLLEKFYIPIDSASCDNIKKLNEKADKYIKMLNKAENCN